MSIRAGRVHGEKNFRSFAFMLFPSQLVTFAQLVHFCATMQPRLDGALAQINRYFEQCSHAELILFACCWRVQNVVTPT